MAILAELYGTLSVEAGPIQASNLGGSLLVALDPLGAPVGTLTGDDSVPEAMRPQTYGVRQSVCFEVWFDGVQIPANMIEAPITVTLFRRQPSTFSLSLRRPNPLPTALASLGSPGGKGRWDLYGVYQTLTGWHKVPLISNGISDRITYRVDQDGERHADVSGMDALARYGRRKVSTPDYRAGHGTDAGAVVTLTAGLAGVTCRPLFLGAMYKPFVVTNGEWLAAIQPLLAAYGRVARMDAEGVLSFPLEGYDASARADLVLTDRDIVLDGGTQAQFAQAILTRVTITGTMQTEGDPAAEHTETPGDVVTLSIYSPQVAAFAQASDGTLSATTYTAAPARLIETSRVRTIRRLRGQTPLAETVVTWGWRNQAKARYSLKLDGTHNFAECFLYAGASADDNSPAYALSGERYVPIEIRETAWTYAPDGFLLSTEVRTYAPRITRAAVKARADATTTWESTSWILDRLVLGDGTGVMEHQEIMIEFPGALPAPTTTVTTTYGVLSSGVEPNVVGFLTGQEVDTDGWVARQGSLWLWADGERGQDHEAPGRASSVVTTYVPGEGTGYLQVVATSELGKETRVESSQVSGSYLPAATRDTTGITPPKSTAISGQWIAWALEATHEIGEQVSAETYVESPGAAQALAKRRVVEGAAVGITVQVLALWPLLPTARVSIADIGVSSVIGEIIGAEPPAVVDVYGMSVSHSQGTDDKLLTTIAGNWYPYTG